METKLVEKTQETNFLDKIIDFFTNSLIIFFLPALLLYGVFFVLPIPLSAFYSLFKWRGIGSMDFIGFHNWISILSDKIFWSSFFHNIILVFASLIIQIPIGILLALLVHNLKRSNIFKAAYFLPFIFSAVAIGLVWRYILQPNFGLLNAILSGIGLKGLTRVWLGEPGLTLGVLVGVIGWRFIPFYMIIFLAALKGIPNSIYEAAEIDGANSWQELLYITLPSLKPTVRMSGILIIVGSLKYFPLIWVMTGGGPGYSTEVMATYMYKNAFTSFKMGYGSAVATAMFIIVAIIIFVYMYLTNNKEEGVI